MGQAQKTSYQCYNEHKGSNIIDFTLKKLAKLVNNTKDPQRRELLHTNLQKYLKGKIAISWRNGSPLFADITQAF